MQSSRYTCVGPLKDAPIALNQIPPQQGVLRHPRTVDVSFIKYPQLTHKQIRPLANNDGNFNEQVQHCALPY